ncbi:MAG: HAMP domain-containing histidine kinase [Clostridiaceae bacterium]|jgi:signal transduction histidine kinase|nr:HAMP domain-containing histidine kinase [Clostridia bacterium]MBP6950222.1 HAMP domain-containing histidine kinase [Clostridia bacterium]NMA35573.1 HAMP domain-containing histidine kinase [Clostridiaceae bacterium]
MKKSLRIILILCLIASVASSFFIHWLAGAMMIVTLTFLGCIAYAHSQHRKRKIVDLTMQLRRLLQGDYRFDFGAFEEGELEVLSSDLGKLVISYREQADALLRDKVWLSNSLSDISHQLKTPITSMNVLIELLKDSELDETQRVEFVHRLGRQINRLDWLVRNLLILSKLDAESIVYSKENITCHQLLLQALEPMQINFELKEQPVRLSGQIETVIEVDRNWTAEALTNILKNASEHGPIGKAIEIRVIDGPMTTAIEITNEGEIAPQDMQHLFTRFYRGSHAHEDSVGIGLAICRAITLQQGAQVEVESGEGLTAFRMRFPK